MRDERRQAVQELEQERRGREETRRELEELRRQLQALREARESPQTLGEEPERADPNSLATVESQEGAQRPWWRRVF
jgi:uncharacterized coiled-coil DUF342 family protein